MAECREKITGTDVDICSLKLLDADEIQGKEKVDNNRPRDSNSGEIC